MSLADLSMKNTILNIIGSRNRLFLRYGIDWLKFFLIFFRPKKNTNKIDIPNKNKKDNILIFMPEAGMRIYSQVIERISRSLIEDGIRSTLIRCEGLLPSCALKLTANTGALDSKLICKSCVLNSKISTTRNSLDLKVLNFKSLTEKNLSPLSYDDLLKFSYKSVPVGGLAYYDLSIFFKKDPMRKFLNKAEKDFYTRLIQTAIKLIDYLDELLQREKYSAIISIDEYCLANVARVWASNNGIKAFQAGLAYHFNGDPGFITFSQNKTSLIDKRQALMSWAQFADKPLPASLVREIYDDLIFRMSTSGGHIFSKNYSGNIDSIKNLFGVDHYTKKVIAVFPSSNDEITALEEMSIALKSTIPQNDIFDSQKEWLDCIIGFARLNKEVIFIIKIHPRLLETHRDVGIADEMAMYESMAVSLPDNIKFVWPKDSISAYDILMIADMGLTSWGTMGLEIAKLGIPVVTALTKSVSVTPRIRLFKKSTSIEDFFFDLSSPKYFASKGDLIEACRWHYANYLSNAIYCSDMLSSDRVVHKLPTIRFKSILDGLDASQENYRFMESLNHLNSHFASEELEAIEASLVKLTQFFTGRGMNLEGLKLANNLNTLLKK